MVRLRVLLAWLLLAAIPLQGLAAASMLYCGGQHHGAAPAAHEPAVGHGAFASAAAGRHDHTLHGHGARSRASKQQDQTSALTLLPDASHKCGVCAACCYGVALTPSGDVLQFVPVAPLQAPEPLARVPDVSVQLPDKPPRV